MTNKNSIGNLIPDEVKENLKNTAGKRVDNFKRNKSPRERLENGLPYATKYYPEHFVKMALLIKNNAEFRRMISLAIKDNLIKIKLANPEDKIYISYYWNKFAVKINGLAREFPYKDVLFVNNFAAAIILFNQYSQKILGNFVNIEGVELDVDYANNITDSVQPAFEEKDNEEVSE